MDEIEDAYDDIDNNKLLFIGSSKEKFNFNIFRMPLNFLSAIYNGEISLKKGKNFSKKFRKKNRGAKISLQIRKCRRKRRNKWCIDAGK